jgi:hypothetical protein
MLSLCCLWSCMLSVVSSYLGRVDTSDSKRGYLCSIVGSYLYLIWGSDRNLQGCRCDVATREETTFLYPRTYALFTLHTLLNAIICCSQLNIHGVLEWFPVGGLLVIDAVGWRSMYLVVMPRVNLIVILLPYARYLYSINCPTVICLLACCYLSYGETPLVNCGPQSNFLYIAITCLLYLHFLLSRILLLLSTRYAHSFVYSKPVMRVNSTNFLDEGLRIGEIGRRMNSKVKLIEIGMCQK